MKTIIMNLLKFGEIQKIEIFKKIKSKVYKKNNTE